MIGPTSQTARKYGLSPTERAPHAAPMGHCQCGGRVTGPSERRCSCGAVAATCWPSVPVHRSSHPLPARH